MKIKVQNIKLVCALLGAMTFLPSAAQTMQRADDGSGIARGLDRPMVVFNNWAAYDELSDTVPQTEALCMRLLDKVIELRRQGVQIDAYLMDAFWFDRDGGYRQWHKGHWPQGPGRWLEKCRREGIVPGLWFSTNLITSGGQPMLHPVPEWESSMKPGEAIVSLSEGGYLSHLMETLDEYAKMGIGIFKFDFAYFEAATEAASSVLGREEIVEANKTAFMTALKKFRKSHPGVKLIAYNGFGAEMDNTVHPFRKTVDPRWLEVFDTMYSGDPRPSDLPMAHFWRSVDLYSDQMVREMAYNGLPVERIDNCSLMTGVTGTCYNRAKAAWRSSMILNMARGGWLNVWHGNCDLFDNNDAAWIAKAQRLYLPLQECGRTEMLGGLPGQGEPYGYLSRGIDGGLYTLVNPSQGMATLTLPELAGRGRVLFTDSGFSPRLDGDRLTLGPEQMAVVAYGRLAVKNNDLGVEPDVKIPAYINRMPVAQETDSTVTVTPEPGCGLRVVMRQLDAKGHPFRSWGGGPPTGEPMGNYFKITLSQGEGAELPVSVDYDRVIWSGLSWAVAEVDAATIDPSKPVTVKCTARESKNLDIKVYSTK